MEMSLMLATVLGDNVVRIATFQQALGADLLTDGGLETWASATNLTNWAETIAGTSTVNREASVIHGGTFAARFDVDSSQSSVLVSQGIAGSAINDMWEIVGWMRSNPTGKTARFDTTSISGAAITLTASYAQYTTLRKILANDDTFSLVRAAGSTSSSLYFDDFSIKKVTLNPQVTAKADSIFIFQFVLPTSPIAGQLIKFRYRINSSTPLNDYWEAYLKRNDANSAWDFLVDSVVTSTATNRISVTGVGNPDTIKIVTSGALHDCFTGENGVLTQRGSQINNSIHQTNTIINTLYSTGVLPISLSYAA